MQRPEHLPATLGWPLTHLRCRLPRLLIAVGSEGTRGGQQVQQGLFGDADAAADTDRTQLASGDRLVELVAPDPQGRRGLADGEYLGHRGQRAGGGAGEVGGAPWRGGPVGVAAVARIGSLWPWLLLGGWCCRRRPVCPAVGGGGTIPRSRPRCGVSSQVGGLIVRLLASEAKGTEAGAARGQAPGVDEVLTPTTRVA